MKTKKAKGKTKKCHEIKKNIQKKNKIKVGSLKEDHKKIIKDLEMKSIMFLLKKLIRLL